MGLDWRHCRPSASHTTLLAPPAPDARGGCIARLPKDRRRRTTHEEDGSPQFAGVVASSAVPMDDSSDSERPAKRLKASRSYQWPQPISSAAFEPSAAPPVTGPDALFSTWTPPTGASGPSTIHPSLSYQQAWQPTAFELPPSQVLYAFPPGEPQNDWKARQPSDGSAVGEFAKLLLSKHCFIVLHHILSWSFVIHHIPVWRTPPKNFTLRERRPDVGHEENNSWSGNKGQVEFCPCSFAHSFPT